jgi:hypothetical protein
MQRTLLWFPSQGTKAHANDSTITLHRTVMNFLWPVCHFFWSYSFRNGTRKGINCEIGGYHSDIASDWVIWEVTLCWVSGSQNSEGMSVTTHPTTWCHIQEELSHQGFIGCDAHLINVMCNVSVMPLGHTDSISVLSYSQRHYDI